MVRGRRGFTLIELMIVLTVIGILMSIAVPNYQRSVIRAREAVLSDTLFTLRKAIDEYYADRGRYPDALSDLVMKGYLREIPSDPFTRRTDTWVTVAPADAPAAGGAAEGSPQAAEQGRVYDVHSGSHLVGANGIPYNEW
ncbi:MAG: prepilin-type N-terminal cleavage/methylation domain-containing protein [Geobacteraceae bacterium]|nr:prepilin-type N-terminal cleavage/methylation domain-containing protein [Geobacteraceae bacterium]